MTAGAAVQPIDRLKELVAELADLKHAEALADWDSRVSMPPEGAADRAEVLGTLTRLMHERLVSDELGELLETLADVEDETDRALVRATRRDWERAQRVPGELAAELSRSAGVAVAAWDKA